uniref:Uncharacterized protein n=1 Tax=Myotis myotis TaxID=51298 RepID=A0A7J7VYQ3_MYOMY|nr:hypothetical protein mMyoMyo1_012347 [Myotis myotis]
MVGIGRDGMVEQVSGGARPRWGASCCHQGEPWWLLKILCSCALWSHQALAPAASSGPACTRCRRLVLAPVAQHHQRVSGGSQPQSPLGASSPPPAPEGRSGQQPLLAPADSIGPACTSCWHWPQLLHTISGCEWGWRRQCVGVVVAGVGLLAGAWRMG